MSYIQQNLLKWNLWKVTNKELLALLVGRRGGRTTIRIIDSLLNKPQNKNQLATSLNLDYNTINFHISLMCNHDYVTSETLNRSKYYNLTEKFYKYIDEYNLIKECLKDE